MKKKIALGVMLASLSVMAFGCGNSTLNMVEENMSEMTNVYYMGENDQFYCTLSSGQRETNYLMNGQCSDLTDFALLCIVPSENVAKNLIKANVKIDGVESEVELEINGLNNNYMVDLERQLSGDEVIEVTYDESTIKLENTSENFEINHLQALEIACEEMEDKIVAKKSFRNLNAECYLRILDKKANRFDGIFWCFTVLNVDGESYSIVISTEDGSVLAKSN